MRYHIALSYQSDLELLAQNAQAGKCPVHAMWNMSQLLKAKVHLPITDSISPLDIICSKIIGSPQHWALARVLCKQLQRDDVLFCTDEEVGFPIAALCRAKVAPPKIAVFVHNINRLRGRLALKLLNVQDWIDLFMTHSPVQADFLRNYLCLPDKRVCQVVKAPPTDISFFTPGPASPQKRRPVIGSRGLEKRDYRTLADATQDLNVDVKICTFSPDVKAVKRAFPKEVMPSHMSYRFYDWCELVQLYRDSDVVVISLFENDFQAGLTTLFEAMACRRPVIITRSSGIIGDLIDAGIVTGVNPGDPVGLKQAIVKLLDEPKKASTQAQRGYELVVNQFNHHNYTQALVTKLTSTFGSINNSKLVCLKRKKSYLHPEPHPM
ncbi:glycosyl transferase [Nostocales cyanobacterium HT-58-2]|nr:glycosyl transferase [Nostocales cyanobacterium HT-58-2]